MSRSFDTDYDAAPARWRRHFASITLLPAVVWGLLLPAIGLKLGFGWTFVVCLLATAGWPPAPISSAVPRPAHPARVRVGWRCCRRPRVLAIVGHGREIGLAALLVVYWVQMLVLAQLFPRRTVVQPAQRGRTGAPCRPNWHAAKEQARAASQRQERVPGQHEPRDPHADERHHRHDRAGARHRADATSSASTSRRSRSRRDALLRVINDILDFSKIEAGKLELEPIAVRAARGAGERVLKPLAPPAQREGAGAGLPDRRRRAAAGWSATRAGCGRC